MKGMPNYPSTHNLQPPTSDLWSPNIMSSGYVMRTGRLGMMSEAKG